MDLLITQGPSSTLWKVEKDKRATRIYFPQFGERDLCPSAYLLRTIPLPVELVEKILLLLIREYLKTWNFDLCSDLLLFSHSFTSNLYRQIYPGGSRAGFFKQYHRLYRTFIILENLYDQYLSMPYDLEYACVKMTSVKPKGGCHKPWDFIHDIVITPDVGTLIDLTETQFTIQHGPNYGDNVWLSGNYIDGGIFRAKEIFAPAINIMMVDVFDTLIHDAHGFNHYFYSFFELIKLCFGRNMGLFVMVKEEDDDHNPFITRSDLFIQI